MVERRRFYPRWGRRSSCNFVFVGFLLVGFVRGTWLRLRKVSKPALRDPRVHAQEGATAPRGCRGHRSAGRRAGMRPRRAVHWQWDRRACARGRRTREASARSSSWPHAFSPRSKVGSPAQLRRRTCVRSAVDVAARGDVMEPRRFLFPLCSSTWRRVAQAKFAGISHAERRVRLAMEAGLPGSDGVTRGLSTRACQLLVRAVFSGERGFPPRLRRGPPTRAEPRQTAALFEEHAGAEPLQATGAGGHLDASYN